MSEGDNETPAEAPAPVAVPTESLDQSAAVEIVLRKALAHDGLARGLREVTRAIEREQGQLCILADDCNQPDYKKLIEHLCQEKNVDLVCSVSVIKFSAHSGQHVLLISREEKLTIETNKKLGELVGLHKLNADGEATKIVGCSAALVTDYGEETEALKVLKANISRQG